jgi:poly(hydroxyalkanoate) depolymerase family esterase
MLHCSNFPGNFNPLCTPRYFSGGHPVPSLLTRSFLKATGLTRMGRLMDATRLIQRSLMGAALPKARPAEKPAAKARPVITPYPRSVPEPAANDDHARPPPHPNFSEQSFAFEGKTYPYRLFVPKLADASENGAKRELMPLVVLLHGCKQDALDFSKGTAMNALAGKEQCLVLYPEQISTANLQMCWNWFEPGHQQEGTGEPGMITALTRQVLDTDFNGRRADPNRVYIAGLSAGGAMAAVVSSLHPELFTALGVHSGLPAGAASNVLTAFQAMRIGGQGQSASAMPTIVFHGDGDTTVHPSNGENIAADALAALRKADTHLVKTQSSSYPEGDRAERNDKPTELTRYANASGKSFIEYWSINNGPHAWSGGSKEGSYTDPDGPSASKAMLAFFLQHKK